MDMRTSNNGGRNRPDFGEADPAMGLSIQWIEAHAATMRLCVSQQEIETTLLSGDADVMLRGGPNSCHSAAQDAEEVAASAEAVLLERLAATPATSPAGVAAKLSVIVREAEDNTDLLDFPLPHVRSCLDDIERMLGAFEDGGAAEGCVGSGRLHEQSPATLAAWCAMLAWSKGDEARYRSWTEVHKTLAGAASK